jgi:hypothetical protein
MSELTFMQATVTCRTEGCENSGRPITLDVAVGGSVVCGPCGADITDVTTEAL